MNGYKVIKLDKTKKSIPRLIVFRSNKAIYAQLISNSDGKIMKSSCKNKKDNSDNKINAQEVGKEIANFAKKKKISQIIFERGKYRYKGLILILIESIRSNGVRI